MLRWYPQNHRMNQIVREVGSISSECQYANAWHYASTNIPQSNAALTTTTTADSPGVTSITLQWMHAYLGSMIWFALLLWLKLGKGLLQMRREPGLAGTGYHGLQGVTSALTSRFEKIHTAIYLHKWILNGRAHIEYVVRSVEFRTGSASSSVGDVCLAVVVTAQLFSHEQSVEPQREIVTQTVESVEKS